jgi:aromatic-L-amino-acid decarboxylase
MDANEFRTLGHAVVDKLADYLSRVEDLPLFPKTEPAALRRLFDEPVPRAGEPGEAVLREVWEKLLPNCAHVNHPGYFGLMTATPTTVGILADLIASALNQNIGSYSIGPGATEIERRTVRWLCDLAGYGPNAGGNLTSGGTLANLLGVKLARDYVARDATQNGVHNRWAVYVSEERHVSIDKAVDMVGLGRSALRALPTDDAFRVRLDALEDAIRRDKAQGIRPLCIIAIAGTTNTGSVDPIRELAAVAKREGVWLHIDAAYGGGLLVSSKYRGLLDGIELGDSITIDPHKWFYAPVDAGAVLVKDEANLTASFGMVPPYLTADPDRYLYYVHGFEQSRRFRSLKVWMSFKRYGADEIARWIEGNIEQARRLAELCSQTTDFKLVTEPKMSAICIRYERPGASVEDLTRLHARVVKDIEQQGRFWISTTVLKGRPAFRINPVNFRTTPRHIDELFAALVKACR